MKKVFLVFLFLVFLPIASSFAEIKEADLAGTWYPESNILLTKMLDNYLADIEHNPLDGEIFGFIVPHAGFVYSGSVAAHGYKAIQNIKRKINTVIIVGFNHRFHHDGVAVSDFDAFKTPLGNVVIDQGLARQIISQSDKIYSHREAFNNENSSEMHIPFLQRVLDDFQLVVLHIGNQSLENCNILADALYTVLKQRDDVLLIASTDLSHYLSYDQANKIDASTVALIKQFNPSRLYTRSSLHNHRLMCGIGTVYSTLLACQKLGANSVDILKYANSGDTAKDKNRVVGYLSAVISKGTQKKKEDGMLSDQQKEKLLKLARQSIEYYFNNKSKLEVKEDDPELLTESGAFVTLHNHGQLRGCIGNIIGRGPLYLTIRDMAVAAAVEDHRFSSVTAKELNEIDIEISVLSPLERISSPDQIVLGKHGVLIRKGFTSGVFLPQVATETGWSKEEFLSQLCFQKAGLPPDAWKDKSLEIYIFSATVFSEKDH